MEALLKSFSVGGHKAAAAFRRAFPTPQLLYPHAAGIDISDASVRWLVLSPRGSIRHVLTYGEESLPHGVVVNGAIQDVPVLAGVLAGIKKRLQGIECAHAALPEEAAYVFSMSVPADTPREQILNMIEFELPDRVPVPPSAAVFDFDLIEERAGMKEIGVIVFPRELAQSYADVFGKAGIELLSLELEARSIARAIWTEEEAEATTLLADFGRARTGFAVLKHGVPIFTSTVNVGGEAISQALMKKLSLSAEAVEKFTDEEGLLAKDSRKGAVETLSANVSAFADEVSKHFRYWDTRRNEKGDRVTPVHRVVLTGGSANVMGLTDFVAARIQMPVEIPNVWRHVASFDDYIPPIDRKTSLQFATSIGLAMRAV